MSVSLSEDNRRELEQIADEKKVSVAWVVRDAVEHYLGSRHPLFQNKDAG